MAFPVVPVVGSTVLGAGLSEGARFLFDFINSNEQKPAHARRDLKSMKLGEMNNMTIGDMLKAYPLFREAAAGNIESVQDLQKRLLDDAEKRRQEGSSFDRNSLIETRKVESGISERERDASLERTLERDNNTLGNTITNRGNLVDETLRLRTGETNLQEGVQGNNYTRTMGILDHGGRQFQGGLNAILEAGTRDQKEQMNFIEKMYGLERASMNSPLNMIGRIANIALPAFALFGR